jgi:hypothetical protein
MTYVGRIILSKSELINFIKIDYNNLETYDFIEFVDLWDKKAAKSKIPNRQNKPYIIKRTYEHNLSRVLQSTEFKKQLRLEKLKEINGI